MPKLLVTGASGYLGSALASRARDAGWTVVGTVGARPGAAPAGLADVVALDVRDDAAVASAVRAAAPDVVIHTAYVQGTDAPAVNAGGTEHVARAAADAGVRLVHVSTDAIFDGRLPRPLVEADAPSPVTAYGATKAQAEAHVARLCPDAAIVRTSLIYGGPGHDPAAQERPALAVARGERTDMMFYTDEVRSPIQVDDLAAALLEVATTDWAGPLHVGGADPLSRLDFARLIVTARGHDASALRGVAAPVDRPRFCPLDSSRARDLLRVRLRGAREVLGGA
ncbi:dTDP-4-dehydrorhamnose reductase [Baekduia alba]|uniref:SDR family oxidoreductase n=1 Tax=Baekduia alba TaxID=2997333 RepID=UPI0023421118|nr:SDR family oxidoreductase [Baekduia alba]WCB96829.1 dTDP-4-dehydrorhamnose reductase [Baekduia alba]